MLVCTYECVCGALRVWCVMCLSGAMWVSMCACVSAGCMEVVHFGVMGCEVGMCECVHCGYVGCVWGGCPCVGVCVSEWSTVGGWISRDVGD